MYSRWYDEDPTLSLAVSLLKNSKDERRVKCAEYVIKLASEHGVELETDLLKKIKYSMQRWYDDEKIVFDAFEYLRVAPADTQKEIALEVIEYLQKITR